MKKLKVLLLLVLVLFTTGCGKRVPTTEEKFKDAFKDYKVEDVTSDFNFVNKAFKVTGSNDLVVIFFDCKSVDVTQDIYYAFRQTAAQRQTKRRRPCLLWWPFQPGRQ